MGGSTVLGRDGALPGQTARRQRFPLFLHIVLSGFISREEGEGMLPLWVGGWASIPNSALCRVSFLRGPQSFLNLHAAPLCPPSLRYGWGDDRELMFLKIVEEDRLAVGEPLAGVNAVLCPLQSP